MTRHPTLSSLLVLALVFGIALGGASPAVADDDSFGDRIDGTYFLAESFGGFPAGSRIVTLTSEGRWLSVASTEPAFLFSNQQGEWTKTGSREITATFLNFNANADGTERGVTKAVVTMSFSAGFELVEGSITAETFAAGENPIDPQSPPLFGFGVDFVGQRLVVGVDDSDSDD